MKLLKTWKNDKGIGIGAIIGIVALLAVLGAVIAQSLGGGSSNTSSEQDKLNASAMLMQSGSLKDGIDLLVAKYRDADYDEVELSSNWNPAGDTYGVFNAANGTVEYLVPPKAAFIPAATGDWELIDPAHLDAQDFDGNTNNDLAIRAVDLNDSVCIAINDALGLDANLTPTTTGRTAYCVSGTYWKAINIL